jgi:two-component system, OmpR family, phosphate regulon sensor histidine kinase PhoR
VKERISFNLFYIGLLSAIIAMVVTAGAFRSSVEKQTQIDLKEEASLVAKIYPYLVDKSELRRFASHTLRITLISSEGVVLVESDADANHMENHLNRPEVVQALKTGTGESFRPSMTLSTDIYYYAKLLPDGNIMRLGIRKSSAVSVFSDVYPYLALLLIGILIVSIFVARLLSKNFLKPIQAMAENIDSVDFAGEKTIVYKELVPFVHKIRAQQENIQKQMRRLERERSKLAILMQNMPEGFILLDQRKNVLMINEVAKQYLHVEEKVEFKNILYFSRNIPLNHAIEIAFEGKRHEGEMSLEGRLFQIIVNPVLMGEELSGIICLIFDITDKKNLVQIKEEFTANASHELKTPLTSISGYAEMIENQMVKPSDIPEFAGKIHKEANRLLALTNDIIKLSELDESKGVKPGDDQVDLKEIVQECITLLTPAAAKRNVTLSIQGEAMDITGDRRMLFEMVYNLIDNAIRYNTDNGRVDVILERKMIRVKDTGIGIPEEHQSRIFERFYRVDKSHSKETGGTGLGLAIVKHIAENHEGRISLLSREGVGTEISILFP